jgi:zinc/manganese transport system substrate-binding protein/manganese/iron transport system substrate-binding protein
MAVAAATLAGLAMAGAGCSSSKASETAAGTAKLGVVATTTQVADFARTIGGDKVAVTQILKANVDPHDYEPSPADIIAFGKAKLVAKNGVGLEKWLDRTVEAAGFKGTVVDASQGVTLLQGEDEDGNKEDDPHIWQSPRNAKVMVTNIEKAFVAADSANAAAYEANLKAYTAKLDALDADIEKRITTIPAAQRKLVTNHDAFSYYVDRYKLEFVGSIIPSFDTSAELSGTEIADLVKKIKEAGVKAIFSESSLPPKTAEAIGQQAGVKVVAGEDSLYADTLGPQGSAGDTYLKAMNHNTDEIVKALA